MQDKRKSLTNFIAEAKGHQTDLQATYKEIIGVVNDLKTRSKAYMSYVADIDDGLEINYSSEAEENIVQLAKNIEEFNSKITPTLSNFIQAFKSLEDTYLNAFKLYSEKDGELSLLLEVRRGLLYLSALLRKFRSKIASLQQVNNVLFSLSSSDNIISRESYKENLKKVNSSILLAIEQIAALTLKIETLQLNS